MRSSFWLDVWYGFETGIYAGQFFVLLGNIFVLVLALIGVAFLFRMAVLDVVA